MCKALLLLLVHSWVFEGIRRLVSSLSWLSCLPLFVTLGMLRLEGLGLVVTPSETSTLEVGIYHFQTLIFQKIIIVVTALVSLAPFFLFIFTGGMLHIAITIVHVHLLAMRSFIFLSVFKLLFFFEFVL